MKNDQKKKKIRFVNKKGVCYEWSTSVAFRSGCSGAKVRVFVSFLFVFFHRMFV